MTGREDPSPMDPSEETAVPPVEDLDATDRLLDAIARGGARGSGPEIELLRVAAGPGSDVEMAGDDAFGAAVAAAAGRPIAHRVPRRRRVAVAGRAAVAKVALLASLLAVGVAGAGAVTGVIAFTAHQHPAPERLLRPEITTTEPDTTTGPDTSRRARIDEGAPPTTDRPASTDPADDPTAPRSTEQGSTEQGSRTEQGRAADPPSAESAAGPSTGPAGPPLRQELPPQPGDDPRTHPDPPGTAADRTRPAAKLPQVEGPRRTTAVVPTRTGGDRLPPAGTREGCSPPAGCDSLSELSTRGNRRD